MFHNMGETQITEMELVSQFRCNGFDGYLAWLDHTLEIRDTANYDMEDIDYDIRILDSPEKNAGTDYRKKSYIA